MDATAAHMAFAPSASVSLRSRCASLCGGVVSASCTRIARRQALARRSRAPPCRRAAVVAREYLDTASIQVDWGSPDRRGSFGKVWFGTESTTGTAVVIKCPVESAKARTLWDVEQHVNSKLARAVVTVGSQERVAEYLGKIIVPRDAELAGGVSRIGLVWRRVGLGETLEDFLQNNRIPELEGVMRRTGTATTPWTGRLRVELAERVLVELVELLRVLDVSGIVHRDIKPDNIVVDIDGKAPLRCIDFGSSCDWGSPFKKGLTTATCDPIYSAPERRLNLMAAKKYDVYSVGLIVLRCLWPSLTSRLEMQTFVTEDLRQWGSFERFLNAAADGSAGIPGGSQSDARVLDSEPSLAPLRSLLCTMLEVDPGSRADGK
jgi:Protein kinase domain